jgi:hypothetical protein
LKKHLSNLFYFFQGGVKSGFGVAIYQESYPSVYVGHWKDNLLDGQGRLIAQNYTYEGQWKDNKMDGQGLLVRFG